MEAPSVASVSSLTDPLPATSEATRIVRSGGIADRLRAAVSTQLTSYDVLYEWTQQLKALNEMRDKVVIALSDAKESANIKTALYNDLILAEARVISVVIDRLRQFSTADAVADRDTIRERLVAEQSDMRDALDAIGTEDAKAMRETLFGPPKPRQRSDEDGPVRPPPLEPRVNPAAAAAANPPIGGHGQRRAGVGSKSAGGGPAPQVLDLYGLNAEIKSGPISFDD